MVSYLLDARDKPALLAALVHALAGDAQISFEGDLSRARLRQIPGVSDSETSVLRRNTTSPRQDFVVIPLKTETAQAILDAVVPSGGIVNRVLHIQIAKHGHLAFGAYDNFHPECTVVFDDIPQGLLDELCQRGVLRSYIVRNTADS